MLMLNTRIIYFPHSSIPTPTLATVQAACDLSLHFTLLPVLRDLHTAPPEHGGPQLHPCGQVHQQQVGQGTQKDQFTTSVMPWIYGTINIIFYIFLFSQYV